MIKLQKSEKIDAVIDTGTVLVTQEDADQYK